MKKLFLLLCVLLCGSLMGSNALLHGKAVSAGRSGNHLEAQQLLQKAIISHPYDATVLYDAGVAEFKCGNYHNAFNYFDKAASCADQKILQEEAFFNAGNAAAHLKKYDDALKSYDKILAENPDHKRARHNYEVVKKMKEQEESSNNQDDEGNQEPDQKDNDASAQNESQQDKNDQKGTKSSSQDGNSSDKSEDESDSAESSSDDGQNEHGNDERTNNDTKEKSEQKDSKANSKKSSKSLPADQQTNGGNDNKESDDSPADANETSDNRHEQYNKNQKDQRNTHANPPHNGQEQKDIQSNGSEANTQLPALADQDRLPEVLEGPDKQWMRCALEACDKQDMNHNKQLLKAVVGTNKGDNRAVHHSW